MMEKPELHEYEYIWTTKKEEYALQEIEPDRYLIVYLPTDGDVMIEDDEIYAEIKTMMFKAGNPILSPLYKQD